MADLNVRIIHHKDFLKTTASGELDLAQSKQILLRLAMLNAPPNDYDVLLDVRGATPRLTLFDIAQLVEEMTDHRASFRNKLAILSQQGPAFEPGEFMELYAHNRGFSVRVFDNFEDAILWLATTSESIQ